MIVRDRLGYLREIPDHRFSEYRPSQLYQFGEVVYDGLGNPIGAFPALAALLPAVAGIAKGLIPTIASAVPKVMSLVSSALPAVTSAPGPPPMPPPAAAPPMAPPAGSVPPVPGQPPNGGAPGMPPSIRMHPRFRPIRRRRRLYAR